MTFKDITLGYLRLLSSLSGRVFRLRPSDFIAVVVLFVVNQASFILAAFLPLKILIMLGTEGVPRYLRFLIEPEEKERWILILVGLSAGFYLLYSLTEYLINQRGKSVAHKVIRKADKVDLFEKQDQFISDTFLKLAESWATYGMVIGGFAIGFWLDWRVFGAISLAVVAEVLLLMAMWNSSLGIEHVERRMSLVTKRGTIVNLCSGFNFLVAFGVLFYLFFVGEISNFIIAIIMVLIARQVMVRFKIGIMSAFFLTTNEEKIKALFYDNEQYKQRTNNLEKHFIESLLPENRHLVLKTGSQTTSLDLSDYAWSWLDSGQKNIACFITEPEDDSQLLLKVYANNQKMAFQTERYMHEELQDELDLMPELIAWGDAGGVAVAAFKLPVFENKKSIGGLTTAVKKKLNELVLSDVLIDRFSRATPNIAERITEESVDQLRISAYADDALIAKLTKTLPALLRAVQQQSRKLINQTLNPLTVKQKNNGEPLVLFWHKVSVQPEPCLYSAAEYSKLESKTTVGEVTLKLEQLERLINQQQFDEAYKLVPQLLKLSQKLESDQEASR